MVTTVKADPIATVISLLPLLFILGHRTANAVHERLAQGASLEDLLREWTDAAGATSESDGLASFVVALAHIRKGEYDRAVKKLHEADKRWPEGGPFLRFVEGAVRLQQQDENAAFAAFEGAADAFEAAVRYAQPVYPKVRESLREFYRYWAAAGIGQGIRALAEADAAGLASGLRKLQIVLPRAKANDQEEGVQDLLDVIGQQLAADGQPFIDIFRTAVRIAVDPQMTGEWLDRLARVFTTGEAPASATPAGQLAKALHGLEWPDDGFADDLEAVHAAQPPLEELQWPA